MKLTTPVIGAALLAAQCLAAQAQTQQHFIERSKAWGSAVAEIGRASCRERV